MTIETRKKKKLKAIILLIIYVFVKESLLHVFASSYLQKDTQFCVSVCGFVIGEYVFCFSFGFQLQSNNDNVNGNEYEKPFVYMTVFCFEFRKLPFDD